MAVTGTKQGQAVKGQGYIERLKDVGEIVSSRLKEEGWSKKHCLRRPSIRF